MSALSSWVARVAHRGIWPALWSAGVVIGGAWLLPAVSAETKTQREQSAAYLVQEALFCEVLGSPEQREKLLNRARQKTPNSAPVLWHTGHVRFQNKWVKADDVPHLAKQDLRLSAYHLARDKHPETIEGQLELADWCAKKGLKDQERAHLTKVLELNPDHELARARLAFRYVNGIWVSEAEILKAGERAKTTALALGEWNPKLEKIREGLVHKNPIRRQAAVKRLAAIDDPASIPSMELLLTDASEGSAMALVEALGNFSDLEASLALARQAAFSPWLVVRKAAAEQLSSRSRESYVPAMLSATYTPVQSRWEIYRGSSGRLMHRHVFLREGQEAKELLVLETAYRLVGDPDSTMSQALTRMRETNEAREEAVERQNEAAKAVNERVCWVLNYTTDQTLPTDPQTWWEWWNRENEVYYDGDKQTRRQYHAESMTIVSSTGGVTPYDCLAAGTIVWTLQGPMAIEDVRVGDLVLSQDPESGQLAYKPVLRTTVRPSGPLHAIDTGSETIGTSGGHLFWTSGEGWVKARHLRSGAHLHSADGTVRVSLVEKGRSEMTYNLIVADFNTYFVGEGKVLCHDNTIRRPTENVVPGLTEY